jgi:hypothetical protein
MTDHCAGRRDFLPSPLPQPGLPAGLADPEVFAIARFAAGLAGRWMVEWNEDCSGEVSVHLTPGETDDAVLVFYREGERVHLSVIWHDTSEHIGFAGHVQGLFAAAERQIAARGWTC